MIDQLESDYRDNLFASYTPWTNRYGFKISSIEAVVKFVRFHEGLHSGYVMALKKMAKK